MPIQRVAPPRPFHRAGVQPVLPSWLWNPMPQWLISPSDSERLACWGKRDISQECDNPRFLIRFLNISFPVFFSLGCRFSLDHLKTSFNVMKWVLYFFVPRMWKIENTRFGSFMPTFRVPLCCHISGCIVIICVRLRSTMISSWVRAGPYLFL